MKILKTIFAITILTTTLFSCEDENSPIFIAQQDSDGIEFLNSFASEYLLSDETKTNIVERIIWTEPDFEVQTIINYEIESSTDVEFNAIKSLGTTTETNFAVLVSNLLGFKSDLNLDDDPNSTNDDGLPNNSGTVFLRVKAFLGEVANPTNITYSPIQAMTISILEKVTVSSCSSLYSLGDAIVGIGWNFPGAELICDTDVLKGKISLTAGTFRFFETVGDWGSGVNYTYYQNEGYTIDSNLEDAEDGDNNFSYIGNDGIYTLEIDNQNKEISLIPSGSLWIVGDAVPGGWGFNADTVEFVENTPNIWSASLTLTTGNFRFFQTFDTWDTNNNYAFYEGEEFTIDDNFENEGPSDENFNFIGTPGTYTLTIDAVEKTILLN